MFFLRHLDSFKLYIILIIIASSIIINAVVEFPIINLIAYCFIHIVLIYIGIYYFNKILYLIYFIIGIIFDIFLLNEIGPHLISFMLLILLLRQIKNYFITLNPQKIFLFIIFILILSLLSEIFISFLLFDYSVKSTILLKNIVISLLISYPSFYLFSKIDRLN